MTTISENLQIIADSTAAIKQAIIDKGGDVSGDITTWANAISGLSGEGGNNGAGTVFKITNKLNGQLFGGPSYVPNGDLLHTYTFEGGTLDSNHIFVKYNPNYEGYEFFPNSYIRLSNLSDGYPCIESMSPCKYGCFTLTSEHDGSIFLNIRMEGEVSTMACPVVYIAFDTNGNYDVDFFYVQTEAGCFTKDTIITLSNNTTKFIQDINYNDSLLVWNFDEGRYDSAKPLWIKKIQTITYYYKVILDNGIILNLVGSNGKCHRLFSLEDGMFISATDMVGKTTYTEIGESKVLSCDLVQGEVDFYNVITDYHMNLFANGVLTSCRYNNLYSIQDMKFVKDSRLNRAPKWKLYEQFRDHRELDMYINGLRLYEQLDIPFEETIKYCARLNCLRKVLDEFEGNKNIVNTIEDTEVGWIDRNGKTYGFKLYMPGQNNHIILADKICKELNIETANPSRYLEKEGWVKYTTDFVLNSDDKEINDKQLKSLHKFLKVPNKLKKDGKIRIGDCMSPHVDISEFDTMDKYSFEYRKKI